jgi:putative ABC transport system permease protein
MTIIGVVGDVRHSGIDAQTYAAIYVPYIQRPVRARDVTIAIKTSDDPTRLIAGIRDQIKFVDKNLPASFDTMEQFFSRSIAIRRYNMLLIGIFAVLAILLSVVGIYGVMSYSVTQSTREIGVRMALGAQQSDVLKLILGNGMMLTAAGVVLGLVAAFGLTRLMASLLFGVSATDTLVFASVALLLTSISMLACYLPARRATKVDPMVALRYE